MWYLIIGILLGVGGLVAYKKVTETKELEAPDGDVGATRPQAKPAPYEHVASRVVARDPKVIKPGDTVWLSGALVNDSFEVHAAEIHDDGDEKWYEFKLVNSLDPDNPRYLCCSVDEEDRWVWSLCDEIPAAAVGKIAGLVGVTFNSSKRPPKSLTFKGVTWKSDKDDRDYKDRVIDRLIDRPEEKSWVARVTDYYDPDDEDRELSLELWEGRRGICLTLGRPFGGTVEMMSK